MSNIIFCAHLARAVRLGHKTVTWKPLSPADIDRRINDGYVSNRTPFGIDEIVRMEEPWGYVNNAVVYASSFVNERRGGPFTIPAGFRPMDGMRGDRKLKITTCELRNLNTIDEVDATLAGTIPPDGGTYLAEFIAQWESAYRDTQAWAANPLCWHVTFTIV
jgi:hypothetical protein